MITNSRQNTLQLTSIDVERSFSVYKRILTDSQQNLTETNVEMYNVINYNQVLFKNGEI
jgi:hypothetical protein